MTELCKLAEKYGVDKCPKIYHYYTPKYHRLLKDKTPEKFLEIGIGNHKLMSGIVGEDYKYGASLRMWREYFKDAEIYGCDILEEVIFQDERITTFLTDQSNPNSLLKMMDKIGMVDIILDDGSHQEIHQQISFKVLWYYVKKGGYYIIEDIFKDRLDDMSEMYKIYDDCEIRHIHQHNKDNQGFIVFKKI
tara:strand:- start:6228 stop:6800 length:573 start_codon:yes stop_codon:yes gene_type:complete